MLERIAPLPTIQEEGHVLPFSYTYNDAIVKYLIPKKVDVWSIHVLHYHCLLSWFKTLHLILPTNQICTRYTRNPYPIYNFLPQKRLPPSYWVFISNLSSVSIPKNVKEALTHLGWRQAMVDEMDALHSSGTCELGICKGNKLNSNSNQSTIF